MTEIDSIESSRLEVQKRLEFEKTTEKRNQLGQFATPTTLANEMLEYATSLLPVGVKVRFLDPAFGTGSFYSALIRKFPISRIKAAVGYEIDPDYGHAAQELWGHTPLQLHIADFTKASPPRSANAKFNLVICNPPYVRHHHIGRQEKQRLMRSVRETVGVSLNGLTGLHCYFLCLLDRWMAQKGLAVWLIPSEFMDVNYGEGLKKYLLSRVTLLRIHRFDPSDVQFKDALVSSAVVWLKKAKPPATYNIEFTQGGTPSRPSMSRLISTAVLRRASKWGTFFFFNEAASFGFNQMKLRDLFEIKRGLATGADKFFILTPETAAKNKLPAKFLRPILPQPRYLSSDEIEADSAGNPLMNCKLSLLACDLSEDLVKKHHPALWEHLQVGVRAGIDQRYLCKHRSPWYSQEERAPSPLLCTYMGRRSIGRDKPLRFILNYSKATATNVYLMLYPKPPLKEIMEKDPSLPRAIWQALNEISWLTLVSEGRIYGGGLCKLEPKELGNAPADKVMAVLPKSFGEHAD